MNYSDAEAYDLRTTTVRMKYEPDWHKADWYEANWHKAGKHKAGKKHNNGD